MAYAFENANTIVKSGTYSFDTAKNKIFEAGKDITDNADKLKKAAQAFAGEFEAFVKTEKIDDAQIQLVRKVANNLSANNPDAVKAISAAFTEADGLAALLRSANGKKLSVAQTQQLEGMLLKNPEAINLLETAEHNLLNNKNIVDLGAIRKVVVRVEKLHGELEALYKTGKYDEAAIKKIFATHGTDTLHHLDSSIEQLFDNGVKATKGSEGIGELNISTLAKEVENDIASFKTSVKDRLSIIATKQAEASGKRWGKTAAENAVKDEVTAFGDLLKNNADLKHHAEAIIAEHPEKAVLDKVPGLKTHFSDIGKAAASSPLGKAAETVAKSGSFWRFTKTLEEQAHLSPEQLKGIKGLWNARGGLGKTALIGVPLAVGAYFVAGVGRKPEEKYTSMVNDQQQAQAAGRA